MNRKHPATSARAVLGRWFPAATVAVALAFGAPGAEDMKLSVGRSLVLDRTADVARISISNPEVVDAVAVTTREILVNAKAAGLSTLVIWSKAGERTMYAVTVERDLEPSLHLTRKAVSLLAQIGLSLENYHVIVNRAGRADEVTLDAMAKIFRAPVYATFPNDYLSLHKALSAGQPIGPCALERALWEFARAICSQPRRAEAPAAEPACERAV